MSDSMAMCMKGLSAGFSKAAENERTKAACHEGLSECAKAAGFYKGDRKDFHAELAKQHNEQADHFDACAEYCKPAAALPAGAQGGTGLKSDVETNLDGDASAKIATTVIDSLRKEFGERMVELNVSKVLPTNPLVDGGLRLVGRGGGLPEREEPIWKHDRWFVHYSFARRCVLMRVCENVGAIWAQNPLLREFLEELGLPPLPSPDSSSSRE